LNRFAGFAFFVVQQALYNEAVLALARLTDPAAHGPGRENLTLERLADAVEADGPDALAAHLREHLADLDARCAGLRRLRNQRIAHSDLGVARNLAVDNEALPGPSRREIEDALATVRRAMNLVSEHYDRVGIGFEHVMLPPGSDGDAVIEHLEDLAHRLDEEGPRDWRGRPMRPAGE